MFPNARSSTQVKIDKGNADALLTSLWRHLWTRRRIRGTSRTFIISAFTTDCMLWMSLKRKMKAWNSSRGRTVALHATIRYLLSSWKESSYCQTSHCLIAAQNYHCRTHRQPTKYHDAADSGSPVTRRVTSREDVIPQEGTPCPGDTIKVQTTRGDRSHKVTESRRSEFLEETAPILCTSPWETDGIKTLFTSRFYWKIEFSWKQFAVFFV